MNFGDDFGYDNADYGNVGDAAAAVDDDEDGADENNGATTTVAMTISAVLFEITICSSRAQHTIVRYFMGALTQLFIYN